MIDYTLPAARYLTMSGDGKTAVHEWFALHKLDPADVPLDARILLDEGFNEFSVPVYPRLNGVHFVREDGEVAQVRVRRANKALPPWVDPSFGEAVAEPQEASA